MVLARDTRLVGVSFWFFKPTKFGTHREANRAVVDVVRRNLVLERRHNGISGRIERVALLPASEIEARAREPCSLYARI